MPTGCVLHPVMEGQRPSRGKEMFVLFLCGCVGAGKLDRIGALMSIGCDGRGAPLLLWLCWLSVSFWG